MRTDSIARASWSSRAKSIRSAYPPRLPTRSLSPPASEDPDLPLEPAVPIQQITELIRAAAAGESDASEALYREVYAQLRSLAGAAFAGERGNLLQPTALVNEAWLKMEGHLSRLEDRRHFLRVAARAMRQVLANYAQAMRTRKREGRRVQLTTLSGIEDRPNESFDALALEEALQKLTRLNSRHAHVVEMRFLCAFTIEETAEALGVSQSTVESDWVMARAWLRQVLKTA